MLTPWAEHRIATVPIVVLPFVNSAPASRQPFRRSVESLRACAAGEWPAPHGRRGDWRWCTVTIGREVPGLPRIRDGGSHGCEGSELPAQAGDIERHKHGDRGGGQPQAAAEQAGPAAGVHEHGQPTGVAEANSCQIQNKLAGTLTHHAEESLTQHRSTGDVKLATQGHDGRAALRSHAEEQSAGRRGGGLSRRHRCRAHLGSEDPGRHTPRATLTRLSTHEESSVPRRYPADVNASWAGALKRLANPLPAA